MSLAIAVRKYQARDLPGALLTAQKSLGRNGSENSGLHALMGKIQLELGRRREAADAFVQAAHGSANAANLLKLAVSLYIAVGADREVLLHGLHAVGLNPSDADFAFSVAEVLFANGCFRDMVPVLDHLDRRRDNHLALIINHYRLTGRQTELAALLHDALATFPGNAFIRSTAYVVAREICDTTIMAEHAALMANPDAPLARDMLAREAALARLAWSDNEAVNALPSIESAQLAPSLAAAPAARRPMSPPGSKLRIGYFSNDFFDHATMTLFREAMAYHDRERFEVSLFCYSPASNLHEQQAWPAHLRDAVVRVADLSDAQAAAMIDAAGIDILVDLKGHTLGARLAIVNHCRAPVKATYLGFPGSVVGVDLDYAITDRIVTPDSSQPFYHEKLCRLPESYQANSCEGRPLPEATTRAEHGLPDEAFVIASFNATHKINLQTIDLWSRVLMAVPHAIFWCMCPAEIAAANLAAALSERGVDRDRLVMAMTCPYPRHISRLPLADLAIDTWPYNGHTTTSDMLWAGLPVVALKGSSFASRVSESLLTAMGLPDLVASSPDAYVALVAQFANDRAALAGLRRRIDEARFTAPLFDAERFTRHLERAFETMAERARAGLAPDRIDVPALAPRAEPFRRAAVTNN